MATKKEKRARGLAKREEFLKRVETDGLAALEADQRRRKEELDRILAKNAEIDRECLQKRMRPANFARVARNKEVTVGELLDLVNELMPIFSDK